MDSFPNPRQPLSFISNLPTPTKADSDETGKLLKKTCPDVPFNISVEKMQEESAANKTDEQEGKQTFNE